MPGIIIKLEPSAQLSTQLFNGAKKSASNVFVRRAIAGSVTISREIGEMLVNEFNNTDVAKSLRGGGSEDLAAHFGLSDSRAYGLADGMAELIKSSVRILSYNIAGFFSIRIQAIERDWSKYLDIPGAKYPSHPSDIIIPVMKWLLIDPNIDIGQAAYDIVFKGSGGQFDTRIQQVSRSGRAIMVSLKALGGSGGYVLPAIVRGQLGQNFIEYTLGQQEVAKKAAEILIKRVR